MNGTHKIEAIKRSAASFAAFSQECPLSVFEFLTFDAREEALFANCLKEWWDEFWHGFALTVAQGGYNL